jgi:hypothetical protein
MTSDPYRNAYDKAIEDLTLISQQFERLSTRKKLVENLVTALHPVFDSEVQAAPEASANTQVVTPEAPQEVAAVAESPTEAPDGYSFLDVPAPLPEGDGDPFQRRVRANFRVKGLTAHRSY